MNDLNKYLVLTEERNAIDNLVQSLIFLGQIEQNLFYLKWFIIAFHSTVYSFMLLALGKIDSQLIYQENKSKKKLYKTQIEKLESEHLITFLYAYDLLKNEKIMKQNPFKPKSNDDVCMKELNNKLRNQMIHFRPMAWASEAWYPARACLPLLELIKFCIKNVSLEQSEKITTLAYVKCIEILLSKHAD